MDSQYSRGGFTCCVPLCNSNSKRDKTISFYGFPSGNSKEKKTLRKLWLHNISRKNFKPTSGHRVCSKHFVGGKKTYSNNCPTITPKNSKAKVTVPRKTYKATCRIYKVDDEISLSSENEAAIKDSPIDFLQDITRQKLMAISHDHDYTFNDYDKMIAKLNSLKEENAKLKLENYNLIEENRKLKDECNANKKLIGNKFSVDNVKEDDELFRFYTGFPNYSTFSAVFKFFGTAVNNLVYRGNVVNERNLEKETLVRRGRKHILSPENEFFIVLTRLRLGILEEDLAYRTGMSQSSISRICTTWIDFLHCKFRTFPICPSKLCVIKTMPKCFTTLYPSTRVIIDCTEFFLEVPSSVRSQSATYSTYKSHNTAKGLIGISPAGAVSFVSNLYVGRNSDKQATIDCGILKMLETGDSIMADRGFDLENVLPAGISLNIPPFLKGKPHLNKEEERNTREIASLRIDVERAISRIKTYRILHTVFPISMASDLNKIWIICAYLTNFLPPIIKQ